MRARRLIQSKEPVIHSEEPLRAECSLFAPRTPQFEAPLSGRTFRGELADSWPVLLDLARRMALLQEPTDASVLPLVIGPTTIHWGTCVVVRVERQRLMATTGKTWNHSADRQRWLPELWRSVRSTW